MKTMCYGICDRFLKNIARFYGRTQKGTIRWTGSKTQYDDRVYNRRVMKGIKYNGWTETLYVRCSPCGILLISGVYESCPCCGNSQLTLRHKKGGR